MNHPSPLLNLSEEIQQNLQQQAAKLGLFPPSAPSFYYAPTATSPALSCIPQQFQYSPPSPPAKPASRYQPICPAGSPPEGPKETGKVLKSKILSDRPNLRRPASAESEKEMAKKEVQRRLRLKMLKRGHLPPNPTFEELQLCGIQPAPTTYAIAPIPCYYVPQNPYEGSASPMYMPYQMYPPSPQYPAMMPTAMFAQMAPQMPMMPMQMAPEQMMSPMSMQMAPEQMLYQQPHPPMPVSAPPRSNKRRNSEPKETPSQMPMYDMSLVEQHQQEYFSATSSQQTMSPHPANTCPSYHASRHTSLKSSPFYDLDGIFSEQMLQEAETLAHELEPFLLPDRELPAATFESFFGTDFGVGN